MNPVTIKEIDATIKIGYGGKKLGNVQTPGRETNASFEEFITNFPDKIVYDMPAIGKDHIVKVDGLTPEKVWGKEADALITENPNTMLTLRAADCIPLVFYVPGKKILGLAHVGTSGAALHLPRKVLEFLDIEPGALRVYVGPHISQKSYRFEKDKFEKKLDESWNSYISSEDDGIHINLLAYIIDELKSYGLKTSHIEVEDVDTGGNLSYFSHRRHKLTGEPAGRNIFGACIIT